MTSIIPPKKRLAIFFTIAVITVLLLRHSAAQNLLPGQLPCIDNYEPNDEKTQSTQIVTDQEYHALISTPLDIDWFKFTLTSAEPNILIRLFHLPQDYNIFLYDSTGAKIGSSKNEGSLSDSILLNGLPSGKYSLKVRARAGQYDLNNCYVIRVKSSPQPLRASNVEDLVMDDWQFELHPNPVMDKLIVQCDDKTSSATFTVYNFVGMKIPDIKDVQLDENGKAIIDVSQFSAGEYFLQIKYEKGVKVKKFIVTK